MQKFLIIIFWILVVVFGPIASIVSVNVLFEANIPITLYTWLAALWITLLVVKKSFK